MMFLTEKQAWSKTGGANFTGKISILFIEKQEGGKTSFFRMDDFLN